MTLRIRPIAFDRERKAFIELLWRIYDSDPMWVPPLHRMLRDQLDPKKNLFLQYGTAQLFLAERDGEVVGRISAHINPVHDETHDERGGFFGFFESIDDPIVAQALFESAEDWLAQHNVEWIRGPISFTMNQEVGVLIEGWDTPPVLAMAHTRDYYPALIERAGYHKAKDLYAWSYAIGALNKRLAALHKRVVSKPNIKIRTFDRKHLRDDIRLASQIFNEAWSNNWGFVPIGDAEADGLADELAQFAGTCATSLIEIDGEPAGMVVGVPDLNHVIRDLNGRLFPLGALKLKWRLWRGTPRGRVILLGVRPKFQQNASAGMAPLLLGEIHYAGERCGYKWAELSWVLEDNDLLNKSLSGVGAHLYKRYRIYQKDVAGA
jgi:hypothetical protein